ncbi:MAG: YbbR-like domain-containing protein [Kiritimatiellia bacterium]
MILNKQNVLKMCRENLSVKLLAFTLAAISIYSIQRITNQTEEFEVPILVEVEPGMAILRQDARYAYITCRGSREDLRRVDQNQLRLMVRTKTAGIAGTEIVPIGFRNVQGVPRSITVTKVRPNLLNLTFDREIEKQISVARPELAGRPAIGRAEIEFSPKIVTVRGPQQLLADLKIMQTQPIDVENASVSFSRELPVLIEDETGVWEVIPQNITARVNIVTEAINREWTDLPILILRNPDTGLVFTPTPATVSVNLRGSPQAVNEMESSDIRVFIDCTAIAEPGIYELPASAFWARSIDSSSAVTPPVISVTAKHIPAPLTNETTNTSADLASAEAATAGTQTSATPSDDGQDD